MCKKRYAGYWDMACAGHVAAGETPKQGAVREAKEEIGLDISEDDVELLINANKFIRFGKNKKN